MKQKIKMKTINIKAMKTRILSTALMIMFTTGILAEPGSFKSEDSLYTSHLALMNGSNSSETFGYNVYTELLPSGVTLQDAAILDEWVESREAWESEAYGMTANTGMEVVNLEGWYDSRESWEQESPEMTSSGTVLEPVNLEEWIGSLESWEQESSASDPGNVAYSANLLEEWVSDREIWEQEVSESNVAGLFNGALQQEWINDRESWEQK